MGSAFTHQQLLLGGLISQEVVLPPLSFLQHHRTAPTSRTSPEVDLSSVLGDFSGAAINKRLV